MEASILQLILIGFKMLLRKAIGAVVAGKLAQPACDKLNGMAKFAEVSVTVQNNPQLADYRQII